jgi:NAD(P)H-dependent FMN reductase
VNRRLDSEENEHENATRSERRRHPRDEAARHFDLGEAYPAPRPTGAAARAHARLGPRDPRDLLPRLDGEHTSMSALRIAIVTGSTRPGRVNESVARWVHQLAEQRTDAEFELVDIAAYELPLLDEPTPPMFGNYSKPHTKSWAHKIGSFDGYVFVTPEYNHGTPGALKNAIDFLFREWNNKAAGFVSYGAGGGARAAEHLRLVLAELMVATVRAQVMLSLHNDFEHYTAFKPLPHRETELKATLDQVVSWAGALKSVR